MIEYSERTTELALKLLNRIVSITSLNYNNTNDLLDFKPLASWFFKDINCSEEDFVLALHFLKDYHLHFYDKLNIPPRWDGCAHLEFPHLFINSESVRLEATKRIPKLTFENGYIVGPNQAGELFTTPAKIAIYLIRRRFAQQIID